MRLIFFINFFSFSRSRISDTLSIDEVRLIQLATDMANFEPHSIKEHVVQAIRYIRETTGRRKRSDLNYLRRVNDKTARIVRVTGILAENNAHVVRMRRCLHLSALEL